MTEESVEERVKRMMDTVVRMTMIQFKAIMEYQRLIREVNLRIAERHKDDPPNPALDAVNREIKRRYDDLKGVTHE
jgi:hypothetical protein